MKWEDVSKEDILGALGLMSKPSPGVRAASTLGLFALGLIAGAGAALLLAPKPGAELRRDLLRRLRRTHADPVDGETFEELAP
jgi:hypothetical protein